MFQRCLNPIFLNEHVLILLPTLNCRISRSEFQAQDDRINLKKTWSHICRNIFVHFLMNLCITPSLGKVCKFVVQAAPKCIWEVFAFAYAPCTYHHPQIKENYFCSFRDYFFTNLFFRLEEKRRKGNYGGSIQINDRLCYWPCKQDPLI